MMPNDVFSFVKKKVLQAPESSPRPRPRPKPTRTRNSALNNVAIRQRYGMSESTVEAYKTASAERRSSSVYCDAKSLEKLRNTITSGFQTASETVNKLTVPGGSAPGTSGPTTGRMAARRSVGSVGGAGVAVTVLDDGDDYDDNQDDEEVEDVDDVIKQLSLEAKRDSLDKDNGESIGSQLSSSAPSGGQKVDKPVDPRCKVCFKQIEETEYFRLCAVCVRRVCEDCSASYTSKDEPEHEWTCSICKRGSTNRDVPPSQSFLKASAAAQQRKQLKEKQLSPQTNEVSQVKEPPSPQGMAAIINRVAKKQESFDVNGSRQPERTNSSGLMVPEQSGVRRHSTGNAAISAAALKSLRDAAAKAEDVKANLSERRRPSQSRLNIQPQQPQQQQQEQIQQQPKQGILKTGSQETIKVNNNMANNNMRIQQRQPALGSGVPQLQGAPQQQPRPQYQQSPQHQIQVMKKPITSRGNSSGNLNWQQNLQQPTMSRRASSVFSVNQIQLFNQAGNEDTSGSQEIGLGTSELLGPRNNDERRASFESAMSDPLAISRLGVQLSRAQKSTSELRSPAIINKDRNLNEEKAKADQRASEFGRTMWKGNQQLSGEGIQIVVDHVDAGDEQRNSRGTKGDTSRHGSFSGPSTTCQLTLYRPDDQDPYGFGLRVVGQQLQGDQQKQMAGQLCARVLWISPGGPAHRAGIKVGDKILEWDGLSLSSLPIERIPQVIEQSEKRRIDLVVKSGRPEDSNNAEVDMLGGTEGGRRRLPSLPPPRASPRASFSGPSNVAPPPQQQQQMQQQQQQHCGWIQLGVGLEMPNLVVTVWSAEGLPMVESSESLSLPKPYAIIRFSVYGSSRSFTTEVESSTQSPVWSAKNIFPNIDPESLVDAKIDVAVWNFSHSAKQQCLGKASIDLNVLELDSTLRWFPLHQQLDESGHHESPVHQKSASLHQQQHIEQQMKQKLRSSQEFAIGEHQVGGLAPYMDTSDRYKMRRKSDCYGDQRTAAAVAFGSNQSFGQRGQPEVPRNDYDRSRRNRSLDRSTELEQFNNTLRGSKRGLAGHDGMYMGSTTHLNLQLGPLQRPPRGYGHNYQMADFPHYGELKLGFFLSDTHLEVEVVTARDLPSLTTGKPDTYVKTYLCEGDRRFLVRKTGIARFLPNAGDPLYRQTVKYLASDISRRTLVTMVATAPRQNMYEYDPMSGSSLVLGVAEIDIDKLSRKQLVAGWYKLFDPTLYNAEHDSN